MGWISKRHMQQGGSLNSNCANNGSDKGPLRVIKEVKRHGEGMFDRDWVLFECGHEGPATTGTKRGRCKRCKEKS